MTDPQRARRIEELLQEERELVLPRFDHDDAWRLGVALRERAAAAGSAVAFDIRRPSGSVLFHAALAGTTADQDEWIRRKSAVVFRFEISSALLAARLDAADVDAVTMGWLASADYAVAGGSVPVRVEGAGVVAAVTASGLSSDEDHQLIVEAIAAHGGIVSSRFDHW